ncbi:MAG: tetratricopeptide repeat protein [Desulforhopalus sp.]
MMLLLWVRTKERVSTCCIPLGIALMLVGGCTIAGKVTPDNMTEMQKEQNVPIETGTKGFVLREKSNLGGNARRDFNRAVTLLNINDFNEAIALLQKVVEQSPRVTAPYINIAIAYRKVGKRDLAEEHLKTALNLFPGHPVASNEYGLLLRTAGRFTEARNLYEVAIKKYPDYLPARKNLAILCDLYLNDQECAMKHYEQYITDNPGDEQVRLWLSELQLRSRK